MQATHEHYKVLAYDANGRRIRRHGRYSALDRKIAESERARLLRFPEVVSAKVIAVGGLR